MRYYSQHRTPTHESSRPIMMLYNTRVQYTERTQEHTLRTRLASHHPRSTSFTDTISLHSFTRSDCPLMFESVQRPRKYPNQFFSENRRAASFWQRLEISSNSTENSNIQKAYGSSRSSRVRKIELVRLCMLMASQSTQNAISRLSARQADV